MLRLIQKSNLYKEYSFAATLHTIYSTIAKDKTVSLQKASNITAKGKQRHCKTCAILCWNESLIINT